MARRRVPVPDRDAAEVRAEVLRVKADKQARWSPARAAWLRCLADGYEAGAIEPCGEVARPGSPPPTGWLRTRQQVAAWLTEHGQPVDAPEGLAR